MKSYPEDDLEHNAQTNPRAVSRGSKIQNVFIGIDSLYLVVEYPYPDLFEKWAKITGDFSNPRLHTGIAHNDFVIRKGANGYKLSLWDGDARLYLTDRVEQNLKNSGAAGQGMGVMLQLGPKWLRQNNDIFEEIPFKQDICAQLSKFGIHQPERYLMRINRLDVTVDIANLAVNTLSIDDFRHNWVGYAQSMKFHHSPAADGLEGLSIGSSGGTVRFKIYNKVAESIKNKSHLFWCSVWGINPDDQIDVTRFEWSVRCYKGNFTSVTYLHNFNFQGFVELLNYVSSKWGRLCIPSSNDINKSRWELAPLWADLTRIIENWVAGYSGIASRDYHFNPDLNDNYLRSLLGWLTGLQARIGMFHDIGHAAKLRDSIRYLMEIQEHTLADLQHKADDKYEIYFRLSGKDRKD